MVETDLRGIDSHDVAMLGTYERLHRAGRRNANPGIAPGAGKGYIAAEPVTGGASVGGAKNRKAGNP